MFGVETHVGAQKVAGWRSRYLHEEMNRVEKLTLGERRGKR